MLKLVYNTTDSAITDGGGYTIGGREWGAVDTTDSVTSTEMDANRLVEVGEDAAKASDNPSVTAALAVLEDRRKREAAARKLDKETLAEAVDPEVVEALPVGGDGLPSKDDLVDAAVATDAPLPKKSTSSRTAAKK